MAQPASVPEESMDHQIWREDKERADHIARVQRLAEGLLLSHPELKPEECVERASRFLGLMTSMEPRPLGPEPPFYDVIEPDPEQKAPIFAAKPSASRPMSQPGFWPGR